MSSPDIHTLTGAYALDALDEFERRQFEAHLARCPDCAREVDELRATAARLAMAVAEQPPDSLRHRVLAQVATTRQEPPAGRPVNTEPRGRAGDRRSGWAMRLTAAAAAIATAAAVVLGVVTARTAAQRDFAQAELAQLRAEYQPLTQLAAAPDARGGTGAGVGGGTVFVLASRELNKAVMVASDLPTPPDGRIYQAWLIGQGQPRSVGLMQPGVSATAPPLEFGGLAGAAKVGLTIEPAGGSPAPTTTPVVLFDLPA
ncbi:MAG TPA: anti-sigma factor [Pseudonocardia sp.]|jgi:anti-sigma-K factor RskA|uniref:anti-sigma factor n=1 Tax=Pseudonocardia sp. TaxID=60912 RepID=UPI002EDB61C9